MAKKVLEILSQNRERTFAVGRSLADFLEAGDVVALTGELGSGKTVFAQGACAGLDVHGYVTSPTYTLIQEYSGRLPVFHIDFYRLETVREIEDLDLAGCLQSGGICLIEWAERGLALLPEDSLFVEMTRVVRNGLPLPDSRRIRIAYPEGRNLEGFGA
jgi:tRNA threonylcarbamoyladenosine biosynthesis protein TsaE